MNAQVFQLRLNRGLRPANFAIFFFFAATLALCANLGFASGTVLAANLEQTGADPNKYKYKEAIREAYRAIKQNPDDSGARLALARIYNDLDLGHLAIRELEHLRDRTDPEFVLALAAAYVSVGKHLSALDLLADRDDFSDERDQATRALLLGKAYLARQDFARARNWLKLAVALHPGDSGIHTALASLAVVENDDSAAEIRLQTALKLNPADIDAHLIKSEIDRKTGRLKRAEDSLTRALRELSKSEIITPKRIVVLQRLVQILTQQGLATEALTYSRMLAEINPEGQDSMRKVQDASALIMQGDLGAAEEILSELYAETSHNAAGIMLGTVKFNQNDFESAEKYLSENLDPETATPFAKRLLAASQLRLNRPSKAAELLEVDPEATDRDAELLGLYSLALIGIGNVAEAEKKIDRAVALNPDKAILRLDLVRHYLGNRQTEAAARQLEKVYNEQPKNTNIQSAYVRYFLSQNHRQAADQFVEKLIENHGDLPHPHVLKGQLALLDGDTKSAKAAFTRAQDIDARHIPAYYGMAQTALAAQDYAKCIDVFGEIIALVPQDTGAYKGLLHCHELAGKRDQGLAMIERFSSDEGSYAANLALAEYFNRNQRYEEATAKAEQAFSSRPSAEAKTQLVLAHYQIATAALRERQLQRAREQVENALQFIPTDPVLLKLAANVEIMDRRFGEAKKIVAKLEAIHPNQPLAKELRGDIEMAEGDRAAAINAYQQSWKTQKSNSTGRKLYLALIQAGNATVAESVLNDWLTSMPDDPDALTFKGMLSQMTGDEEKAIQLYTSALAQNPNQPMALNNLANIYSERDIDKALKLANRAFRLASDNAAIADTYGWILVQNGSVEEGIVILEHALKLLPGNAGIKQHLETAKSRL